MEYKEKEYMFSTFILNHIQNTNKIVTTFTYSQKIKRKLEVISKVVDERKNLFPMSADGRVKRMGKRFWRDRHSPFSIQKIFEIASRNNS
ncbi:hypothetical protein [Laceyella putida]|uniref:Uncharacterized protein n=1 Tax=Laceyella putida TaxID=110101 RepID=A0ABW2RPE5_9BACL